MYPHYIIGLLKEKKAGDKPGDEASYMYCNDTLVIKEESQNAIPVHVHILSMKQNNTTLKTKLQQSDLLIREG